MIVPHLYEYLTLAGQVSCVVTALASILANYVSPASRIGKVVHVLALNGPRLQAAAVEASKIK